MGHRILHSILVLLVSGHAARADYEETERRLKSAGIDQKLRLRIHDAIDRGVDFLLTRQGPEGFWPRSAKISHHPKEGVAAVTRASASR